jgi:hypothetical protein
LYGDPSKGLYMAISMRQTKVIILLSKCSTELAQHQKQPAMVVLDCRGTALQKECKVLKCPPDAVAPLVIRTTTAVQPCFKTHTVCFDSCLC